MLTPGCKEAVGVSFFHKVQQTQQMLPKPGRDDG